MAAHDMKPRTGRIPSFATREEMADFWDTHDISDYWDELEPVEVEFATPVSRSVALQIDIETWEEIEGLARERGLPPDGLLHVWILERRDAEREHRKSQSQDATTEPSPLPDGRVAPAAKVDR